MLMFYQDHILKDVVFDLYFPMIVVEPPLYLLLSCMEVTGREVCVAATHQLSRLEGQTDLDMTPRFHETR